MTPEARNLNNTLPEGQTLGILSSLPDHARNQSVPHTSFIDKAMASVSALPHAVRLVATAAFGVGVSMGADIQKADVAQAAACNLTFGFAQLQKDKPAFVGVPIDCPVPQTNGDVIQHAVRADGTPVLLDWDHITNTPRATDGGTTIMEGPYGVDQKPANMMKGWEIGNKDKPFDLFPVAQVVLSSAQPSSARALEVTAAPVVDPTAGMSPEQRGQYWSSHINYSGFSGQDLQIEQKAIQKIATEFPDTIDSSYWLPGFTDYIKSQWTSKYPTITAVDMARVRGKTSDRFMVLKTIAAAPNADCPTAFACWYPYDYSKIGLKPSSTLNGQNLYPEELLAIAAGKTAKESVGPLYFDAAVSLYKITNPTQDQLKGFIAGDANLIAENFSAADEAGYFDKHFPNTDLKGPNTAKEDAFSKNPVHLAV